MNVLGALKSPAFPHRLPNPMRRSKLLLPAIAILGTLAFFLLKSRQESKKTDTLVSEVVGSEELILKLTPKMGRISDKLLNLSPPESSGLFIDSVTVRDLSGEVRFEAKPPAGQLIAESNLAWQSHPNKFPGQNLLSGALYSIKWTILSKPNSRSSGDHSPRMNTTNLNASLNSAD